MGKRISLPAVVWKEGKWYVAVCAHPRVASQGRSVESALKNLKEAVELYLEDEPKEARLVASESSTCSKISIELPVS